MDAKLMLLILAMALAGGLIAFLGYVLCHLLNWLGHERQSQREDARYRAEREIRW